MLTLLVPVDGSPGSDRAVELVIKLHRDVTPVRVRLLHVLPPNDGIAVDSTRPLVASDKDPLIGPDEEPADGKLALSSARALLDRAEIPYGSEVDEPGSCPRQSSSTPARWTATASSWAPVAWGPLRRSSAQSPGR